MGLDEIKGGSVDRNKAQGLRPRNQLLLLLLSHFSRVRLCATPQTAAHQAPQSLGILQARTLEWVAISFSNA